MCAFNILNGPEPGRDQNTAPSCSSRTPILQEILTDNQKPTGTMPIVQHSLDNTKRHTMTSTFHHNHFQYGWSKSTSTQSTTLHTDNFWVLHLINWLKQTGGLCQANGGGVTKVKGHAEWGRVHPTHATSTGSTQLQPNLRHQSHHHIHMHPNWQVYLLTSMLHMRMKKSVHSFPVIVRHADATKCYIHENFDVLDNLIYTWHIYLGIYTRLCFVAAYTYACKYISGVHNRVSCTYQKQYDYVHFTYHVNVPCTSQRILYRMFVIHKCVIAMKWTTPCPVFINVSLHMDD